LADPGSSILVDGRALSFSNAVSATIADLSQSSSPALMDSEGRLMIRLLAAGIALVGFRYAAIGVSVLGNLHIVVTDWVAATGDPDFRLDYPMWHVWAIGLSLALIALGTGSAIAGASIVARATWARRWWLPMMILSVPVHTLWILSRVLSRRLTRWTFLEFGLVCAMYVVLWAHQRSLRALRPARAAVRV
jgi:hypothetical protein